MKDEGSKEAGNKKLAELSEKNLSAQRYIYSYFFKQPRKRPRKHCSGCNKNNGRKG